MALGHLLLELFDPGPSLGGADCREQAKPRFRHPAGGGRRVAIDPAPHAAIGCDIQVEAFDPGMMPPGSSSEHFIGGNQVWHVISEKLTVQSGLMRNL